MEQFTKLLDAGRDALSEGRFDDAIELFLMAKDLNTSNAYVCRLLGNCLRNVGRVEEAIDSYREGLERGYHTGTHSRLLNALNYTDISPQAVANEHKVWASNNFGCVSRTLTPKKSRENAKIRVGYVSADFKSHPVSYFMLPIYKSHDRNQFEIVSFFNGQNEDEISARFASLSDRWYKTIDLDTQGLRDTILEAQIDILVDLSGHTTGNRLDVFALKSAPVQITYLGYPNTTGLSSIDYRIVDYITDPVSNPDSWYSETPYRMPGCFLCFEPPSGKLQVARSPFERNKFVTFGSFNKIAKITDNVVRVWTEILRQVPDAKLLLKSAGLDTRQEIERTTNRFIDAGLDHADRLLLHSMVPTRSKHLLMYNDMDVALDPFPYNGTTTTMQAVYMSLPVVTLQGASHIARVSSSILCNMNLPELVASSESEYIAKAVALAGDSQRLRQYRTSIRDQMIASRLVNGPEFVNKLETFYRAALDGSSATPTYQSSFTYLSSNGFETPISS